MVSIILIFCRVLYFVIIIIIVVVVIIIIIIIIIVIIVIIAAQSVQRLGYVMDDPGSRVRFPAGAGNFFLHHRVQNGSGAHLAPYPIGVLSLGVKWPGREVDHSPPSSAEVKNAWSYTSTLLIHLQGVVLN
jgi:hypothetical protein